MINLKITIGRLLNFGIIVLTKTNTGFINSTQNYNKKIYKKVFLINILVLIVTYVDLVIRTYAICILLLIIWRFTVVYILL